MKINKKFLQFIAALMILMFHLGISLNKIDLFILRIGYIGVDIFFFLAAYSLVGKKINYFEFLKNRFCNVYLKFILFVIIAAIYKGMTIVRTVKILTFIEFFEKGGGSFLWFVPAIMLFYLIFPFFVLWKQKYKSIIVLAVWFLASFVIGNLLGYTEIFIFTNRIPIIIAGYELKKHIVPNWASWVFLPIGIAVAYLFGYTNRLYVPFTDFYFVTGAVLTVAVCGISGYVRTSKIWDLLGMGTLELYCIQMIFGTKYANWLYRVVENKLFTNIIMVVTMFGLSVILAFMFNQILGKISGILKGTNI